MADSWSWQVAELPYRYAVEIRGDKVVWIWDTGHGIPPTEEAQPAAAVLSQGRAGVPTAWQQIPPPIWDQLTQRLRALAGGGAGEAAATGPTQFAPAVTAAVASSPQGSAAGGPAAPAGWGPPAGTPPGAQQGFGPAQGPPAAAGPASHQPASHQPATQPSSPAAGASAALPTSGSLPTAAPAAGADPKAQVLGLLRAGEKAKAIEVYRHHFKVSAMLAKEEVEYMAQTLKDE